ncbi:MAG TPA: efflux RND transporter permease subunit [bacterium]|jgi:CzcA family heavy metal efflux pump|nr:efflux RND transporter permease subunit [bacterium]HPM47317.1 efflux RND transporter permease subunit [bacterium]HRQ70850.1 efflux RND transporter permease subunit [bacterium]
MWDYIIKWSLNNRTIVFAIAVSVVISGFYATYTSKLDALPDITAPTVTVVTDAGGLAPEEVEQLVTFPIESALNGAPGLRRLRSRSSVGMSIVWAEFEWNTDQYKARQIISERLQLVLNQLPSEIKTPVMAPISSIMGEIMVIGLTGDKNVSPMELRDIAEWTIRKRVLGIPGVAQVTPIGGEIRQVEIILNPEKMRQFKVGHQEVIERIKNATVNSSGGFFVSGYSEYIVRGLGRADDFEDFGKTVIKKSGNAQVLLKHIADIGYGHPPARGSASINGDPGVLLTIQKQPEADTLDLNEKINEELDTLSKTLPENVKLFREGFNQSSFINTAISNVTRHLFESSVLVIFVLFLFLASKRATLISLAALPLSLFSGIIVLRIMGESINTMTLGGFAIAIGALVDDAIIDVENGYRRLRLRAALPEDQRDSLFDNVYKSSVEIRSSIVYATFIIAIVFVPLFFLTGLEGKLMRPLGLAYVVSIISSLLVATTVTPALCMVLLRNVEPYEEKKESFLTIILKKVYTPILKFSLKNAGKVTVSAVCITFASVVLFLHFGRDFMPKFNEGSFSITAATVPGVSLEQSTKMINRLDKAVYGLDFVKSVARRTGRSDEKDEHGHDVQASEMDIIIDNSKISRTEAEKIIRETAEKIPGLKVTVTQPISFKIAHMNTGAEASIVLKIFGEDLGKLRDLAQEVEENVHEIDGLVDLNIEQLTDVPVLNIKPDLNKLAYFNVTSGEFTSFVQTAFSGSEVGKWWEKQRSYDMVVKYPKSFQTGINSMKRVPFDKDGEQFITLSTLAQIEKTISPNVIQRENSHRRITVTANVAGRDGRSVVNEMKEQIEKNVEFPQGYYPVFGGDFSSEEKASRTILWLSIFAIIIIILMLTVLFKSLSDALIVVVNMPLSLIGGTIAVLFMNGIMTVATLVGFITLFGIASRNGIMMISHYKYLEQVEKCSKDEAIFRGSIERLIPIMMTALATAFALIPIVIGLDEPGSEIQAPMALVILGGITTSTFLNMVVLPSIYKLTKA